MLGFPTMGDAYTGSYRHLGRSVGAHHDVIAHVLRRRPQWTHAGAVGAHQRQVHVPDAFSCIPGKRDILLKKIFFLFFFTLLH